MSEDIDAYIAAVNREMAAYKALVEVQKEQIAALQSVPALAPHPRPIKTIVSKARLIVLGFGLGVTLCLVVDMSLSGRWRPEMLVINALILALLIVTGAVQRPRARRYP